MNLAGLYKEHFRTDRFIGRFYTRDTLAVFILEAHYASGRTWARFYYSSDYSSVV